MIFRLSKLQRVTSTGAFISELDGLRFIAIFFVLICHVSVHFFEYAGLDTNNILYKILERGANGVRIFFAISGFILMNNALSKGKISPGKYFKRRLVRLEPTYIIALLIYFIVIHHRTIAAFIPNLFFSIIYCHSFVYGTPSVINPVVWSLEVEVQFYILFPILFIIIGKLQKVTGALFFAGCLLFGITWRFLFPDQFYSLLNCIQFFVPGILAALLFHYRRNNGDKAGSPLITAILSVLVILLLVVESRGTDVLTQLTYCILLFLLFFFVFTYESGFRRFLRKKFIAYTGGMCYTIYLYHILLLLIFDKFLFNQLRGNSMAVLAGSCIYFVCLWFFSAAMFLLFEKPFMKISLEKVHGSAEHKRNEAIVNEQV